MLLGLLALEKGVVPNVLKTMGVDREGLRKQIEDLVSIFSSPKMRSELPFTPRVKRSLKLAALEAKFSPDECIEAEHIFLGLLLEGDGVAGRVLKSLGLRSEATRAEILKELDRNQRKI